MASKQQHTPNVPVEHTPVDESVAVDLATQELARLSDAPTPPAPPLTPTQQRVLLALNGLKSCNRHLMYFDRLPDAAKQPVDGYPVEVRPLAEFAKGAACCRPSYTLYDQAYRDAHRPAGSPTSRQRQEAALTKKIAQRDALTAEIAALQATLAPSPTTD